MFATIGVTAIVIGILLAVCMRSEVVILMGGGVVDARGSIAGNTFSRGAGGNIIRARTKPVNPRSSRQNANRAWVAHLTKHWSNGLTEQQRDDWRAYAAGTTWTNKLGQAIEISGLAAFLQLNQLLRNHVEAIIPGAPLAMGHAGGVTFTFDAESDTSNIEINAIGGAFDDTNDQNRVFFFQGLPTEAGRIGIPKGFRYIGNVPGIDPGGTVYPVDIPAAYTMQDGQRCTIRAMFIDQQYRVAGPTFLQQIVAPS